eukprot:735975-Prymnesium_polylepis.1
MPTKRDGGRTDDGDRADDARRQPEHRLDRLHPSEHRCASSLSWQLATLFIQVDSTVGDGGRGIYLSLRQGQMGRLIS